MCQKGDGRTDLATSRSAVRRFAYQIVHDGGQEAIKTTFDTSVYGSMFRKTARLQPLRYAALAAEFGSFRRVGRLVEKNSSEVSRKIADLEDHLGVSLFERGAFGVRPTVPTST